jgi:hypothetical protein
LFSLRDLLADHAFGVTGEGRFSGEAVVEEDTNGVKVAPGSGLLALELLGRHVADAADDLAGLPRLFLLHDASDAEVRDLDGAFPRNEDVRGLYVAVNDPAPVRVIESPQELSYHPPREPLTQTPLGRALERASHVLPVDVLGHDERNLAVLTDVVDLDDVLVVQGSHYPRLLLEARPERYLLRVARVKRFQGYATPEDRVLRLVDDGHSPRA